MLRFDDGVPVSGLGYTFVALASAADDLDFQDVPPLWTFVPAAATCDPSVTAIRINSKGTMSASGAGGDPFFEVRFVARIK